MAKEAEIRKRVIKTLEDKGWVCWFCPKVRYQESDIFSCYDLICARGGKLKFIQLTTLPNIRAREKKIRKFMGKTGVTIYSEVWGMRKDGSFKIIRIY